MSRPYYTALAVTAVVAAAAFGPLRAQAARKFNGFKAKAALKSLANREVGPQAANPRAAAALLVRGPYVTLLLDGDASLIDLDGDGELGRGDTFIGNGTLVDSSNRELGTWEGTVIDSSPETYFVNITMRWFNQGTLTINGAGYSDGLRSNVQAVPIVGKTGRIRYTSNVGLALTDDLAAKPLDGIAEIQVDAQACLAHAATFVADRLGVT